MSTPSFLSWQTSSCAEMPAMMAKATTNNIPIDSNKRQKVLSGLVSMPNEEIIDKQF